MALVSKTTVKQPDQLGGGGGDVPDNIVLWDDQGEQVPETPWVTKGMVDFGSMLSAIGNAESAIDIGTASGLRYTFNRNCIFTMSLLWTSTGNYTFDVRDENGNIKYSCAFLNNQPNWGFASTPMPAKAGWKIYCNGQNNTSYCRIAISPLG